MIVFESQKDQSDHGVENGFVDVGKLPNTGRCDDPQEK